MAQPSPTVVQPGTHHHSNRPHRRLDWARVKSILGTSFSEWNRQNVPRLGASIAFYSLLSLAPLLLLAVSIVGIFFGHSAAQKGITDQLQSLIGPAAAKTAADFLNSRHAESTGILSTIVSLITLLFSASGVLIELRDDLNSIWEVPVPQVSGLSMITGFIKQRLFSFAMVLAVGFLLVISLLASTFISGLASTSSNVSTTEAVLLHIANILVSFLLVAAVFSAIYKVVPDVHIDWQDAATGGVVTSILFTIGKFLLGLYLGRASYSSMYGAAGSIVVVIAWVYYSAQIAYLGAEFTKVYAKTYGSHRESLTPRSNPTHAAPAAQSRSERG